MGDAPVVDGRTEVWTEGDERSLRALVEGAVTEMLGKAVIAKRGEHHRAGIKGGLRRG